ncbi:MAG: molybdenum cofactor guanylyltransferase [Desulfovibrionaceae bacterium]|nr:molybdenum cofactor guanylyltransferase [Desulfovibrionaceae bacterium]
MSAHRTGDEQDLFQPCCRRRTPAAGARPGRPEAGRSAPRRRDCPCPELLGVVLAGGRSRRMGRDKAGLTLPDGRTFLKRACDVLGQLCPHVAVSWHSTARQEIEGVTPLFDTTSEIGPLGGLASGLTEAARLDLAGMIVLPCDAPLVTVDMILRLVQAWRESHDEVLASVFMSQDRRVHPLVGVWDGRALPTVLMAAGFGEYSLRNALPSHAWRFVNCSPAEERLLVNVNTAKELDGVMKYLAERDAAAEAAAREETARERAAAEAAAREQASRNQAVAEETPRDPAASEEPALEQEPRDEAASEQAGQERAARE